MPLYITNTFSQEVINHNFYQAYYPNKTPDQTGYYNKGKKEGTWKSYDTAGKLINETEYNNGTPVD
ncbi:hypothetical protein [Psychroserpens sp. NJDZ02]|uniref:hypothetical protein n=1 Tax=Psychroserpens sp. NJDZ02 TaxID=2570561 RepID=UPI0010A8BCE3|nr:hypothetical protein [Psychroserpens sp. NJDZ02]QCE42329.1 hypothetical protein E9099_13260 [Psychroserpens sp. NJDZ02]